VVKVVLKTNVNLTLCLIKHHAVKAYGGLDILPCFLHLNIRWRCVVNFMPHPTVSPGESPQYPLSEPSGDPYVGEGRVLNFTELHTSSEKMEGCESKGAATV
jgi:hypothetical protein